MHIPTLLTALTSTLALSAEFQVLKPRNWDLHLLSPGCSPNSSNFDVSLYHRSGVAARSCVSLTDDGATLDTGKIDSISWKSPIEKHYDLCTFKDASCSKEGFVGAVRSDWAVCYPYQGWMAWKVVGFGEECF
ncbi:hypothetical protein P170DRAFT_434282 [Aspergillus steynii IBT 23096]|uniref:Uncharacterized protein n=1 Tax=Aspergillus steynii IBT 23096 TaxID=1392250 RepID=A0A2I2GI52_9EURO|nr:uncharacterized protein P170DRAFT_434282 [Aspergillus steynii IBT 23096]PLB52562.1 hypothetical protein P170DRAFT_434282 [Aspergillus steynii IBT 23096]